MTSIDDKIEEVERQLNDLKEIRRSQQETNPEYMMAEYLHRSTCRYDHTESCSWYYEITNHVHNWEGLQHKRYLGDAIKLLSVANEDEIKKVIYIRTMPLIDAVRAFVNTKKEYRKSSTVLREQWFYQDRKIWMCPTKLDI